jgi:pilus assembly protein CpaB
MPPVTPLPQNGTLRKAVERGTRNNSGVRATIFLALGVAAALAAALLFSRYIDTRTAAARVPTTKVAVAGKDLAEATTLTADHIALVDWPTASLPQGTVADPDKLVGRVLVAKAVKGEPLLEARLAAVGAGRGLAALLEPGKRAVSVRVDDVVGVAGFIHPGDSVDVIVTMKPREDGNALPASKIILQSIRVLAVGQELQRKEGSIEKAQLATVATLMVDSAESEKLALAATKGKILLTLRGGTDSELVGTRGIMPPELLAVAAPKPESPAPPPPAPAHRRHAPIASKPRVQETPPPPPAERKVVEILRGDMFESRDFAKQQRGTP